MHHAFPRGGIIGPGNLQGFLYRPFSSVHRVEGAVGILKYNLRFAGVVDHLSLRRLQQAEKHARQARFSRSAFPAQADDFSPVHGKVNVMQHLLVAVFSGKDPAVAVSGIDVLHLEDQFFCHFPLPSRVGIASISCRV